jgi:hypothetical protein
MAILLIIWYPISNNPYPSTVIIYHSPRAPPGPLEAAPAMPSYAQRCPAGLPRLLGIEPLQHVLTGMSRFIQPLQVFQLRRGAKVAPGQETGGHLQKVGSYLSIYLYI